MADRRISLALVMHNHQPVGNFGWVIEEVYRQAYEPMVSALEAHPGVRVGLHYSGPLLEWISSERPELIDRLRALVDRGQVEILGGGHFEPILVSLPEQDRLGQLDLMRREVERLFGRRPTGAWLAERVWEPSLAGDLAAGGYRYTVLDDNHLRGATVPEDEMWGTYTTDDRGRMLTVFGTEKGLRYRIPWRPVGELIEYLRANATEDGQRLGTMGDDGEKFGAWPGTHELSWGRGGWIEECFSALEANAEWLATVTPSQWMESEPPRGRIYVPTASYIEMTEWALPPPEALEFHRLLADAEASGSVATRFLKGAMWRNFQARYREINDLHKQMLRASATVDAMAAGLERQRALDHLYRGQSNDCYWHGLFGGIYIVHMRMATLHHLIAAEDLALAGRALSGVADYDLDGVDEVLLGTKGQTLLVDVAEGAGIGSWDLRASRLALASALRRRPEAYHEQLRRLENARSEEAGAGAGGAANPHEQTMAKEDNLSRYLVYDDHERRSGLVRVLAGDGDTGDFVGGEWLLESASEAEAVLSRAAAGLTARKRISLGGGRLDPDLRVEVEIGARAAFEGELQLEWNINLMGGGANPDAYYAWENQEGRHDAAGSLDPDAAELRMGNRHEGAEVVLTADPPAARRWSPIETVSNSEAGFERVYQGSCLLVSWPLRLAAGASMRASVTLRARQRRDRAAEEAGAEEAGAAATA
ncbi:MAG TPA: alpha-amylase/4-alpha-glucanotransferase domain-containing protein [Candidatus Limnocylindrales bacterium]|nr:alpha-amylase/4-alpha-glucanotransferase domain-containing protein [Candidatus Limnocylindrales bacterium]